MFAGDIMRTPVVDVSPSETVAVAVEKMCHHDVGFLPVVTDGLISGVLTDRDILRRCAGSDGSFGTLLVAEAMTVSVLHCFASQRIEDVAAMMGDHQVRRLPVCNTVGQVVGVLTVGDIAEDYSEHLAGETLGEIVEFR